MLSVITITFNNFTELLQTLDSIQQDKIESVVINGSNCEKTIQFLRSNHQIRSLSEKDKGISDAFNKGIKLSSGEFITFLNSGDKLIDPAYYADALSYLEVNPGVDFVYADIRFIDQFASAIHVKSNKPLPHMPYLHPTLIVRRETMLKIGPFDLDLKIAMDLDLVYRLIKSGAKGHYIPRMVVEMDGSGVSSKNFTRAYLEVMKVALKNRDFSLRSFNFFIVNGVKLVGKILLLKVGGQKILEKYRKNKYKIS